MHQRAMEKAKRTRGYNDTDDIDGGLTKNTPIHPAHRFASEIDQSIKTSLILSISTAEIQLKVDVKKIYNSKVLTQVPHISLRP